jgi:hypothetical protein
MRITGTRQVAAELAQEYGFFDRDGRRPPSIQVPNPHVPLRF